MTTTAARSALVVLVPEADPGVGRLRRRYDPAARAGLGAHVTLLFPFVPAAAIDAGVIARVEAQLADTNPGALTLELDRVARFPGVVYLALADEQPVRAVMAALAAAWPAYPMYEGRFADVVPHLTVAYGDDAVAAEVEAELAPVLPVIAYARFVTLIVERDGAGDGADAGAGAGAGARRWHVHTRFVI